MTAARMSRPKPAPEKNIIGRDGELETLWVFLEQETGTASAFVLQGEPGIGKTTLWNMGIEAARERGYRVLVASADDAEAQLAFTGLSDLLGPVVPEALIRLQPPQRRALEVALLLEEPADAGVDAHAVAAGLLGVLRELAGEHPLLIAVDDAQWLDPPSAAALEYALRRLRQEPVSLLLGQRSEQPCDPPLGLHRFIPEERLLRLWLGPLSLGATQHLVRKHLASVFSRPQLRQLWETSGGNPFFALELARALRGHAGAIGGAEPLPVPDALHDLVRERVAILPARVLEILRVAAALASPTAPLVAAALSRAGVDGDLDAAVEAGVVRLDGERISFTHPLLASGVYSAIGPGERRSLHRRLSEIVRDPEARARHLALGTIKRSGKAALALDRAAVRAHGRGAPHAAAELSEHALRLTPSGGGGAERSRAIQAAEYHFQAGDTTRARTLLEQTVRDSPRGRGRVDALVRLGTIVGASVSMSRGTELYEQALAEVGDDDRARADIEQKLAWSVLHLGDTARAAEYARAAVAHAEQLGDPALLALALAKAVVLDFYLGSDIDRERIERAIALEESAHHVGIWLEERPSTILGAMLLWAGDLEAAKERFEALHEAALESGNDRSLPIVLYWLSRLEFRKGDWRRGLALAREGYEIAAQTGQDPMRATLLVSVAEAETMLGHVEAGQAASEEGLALAERAGDVLYVISHLNGLASLALAVGTPLDALPYLDRSVRLLDGTGIKQPGIFRGNPELVETLVAVGQLERAIALLEPFEEQGRALDRPWVLATSARCRGLLAAAAGDLEASFDAFDRALAAHERFAQPFELARTLLALGSTQRRAKRKRDARESLERAVALFDELHAPLWVDKAKAELARIGGHTTAQGLTPTERRVAELVAKGQKNREVASALFVSVRAVEANLTRIYAKLGVRSRSELSYHLEAPEEEPAR